MNLSLTEAPVPFSNKGSLMLFCSWSSPPVKTRSPLWLNSTSFELAHVSEDSKLIDPEPFIQPLESIERSWNAPFIESSLSLSPSMTPQSGNPFLHHPPGPGPSRYGPAAIMAMAYCPAQQKRTAARAINVSYGDQRGRFPLLL